MRSGNEVSYAESDKVILFISDNQGDARRIERLFMDSGSMPCRMQHSTNLKDALAYLGNDAKTTDVIILDIRLQAIEGEDFYQQIKMAAPETPVLILTGESEEEHEASAPALEAGAEGTIDREDFATLVRLLRTLLFDF